MKNTNMKDTKWLVEKDAIIGCHDDRLRIVTPPNAKYLRINSLGPIKKPNANTARTLIVRGTIKSIPHTTLDHQNLSKIIFQEGVENIEAGSCHGNTFLTEIELPSTIKDVEPGAFTNCAIKKMTVYPNENLFENFEAKFGCQVEEINIINCKGDNEETSKRIVAMLANLTDEDTSRLKKIYILSRPLNYAQNFDLFGKKILGILYEAEDTYEKYRNGFSLEDEEWSIKDGVLEGYYGDSEEVIIPEGVTVITGNCFRSKKLKKVHLPESLKVIEDFAFDDNSLARITIPASVEKIGYKAFANNFLTTLEMPYPCKSFDWEAFYGNTFKNIAVHETNLQRVSMSTTKPIKEMTIYLETKNLNAVHECLSRNYLSKLRKVILVGQELDETSLKEFRKKIEKTKREDRKTNKRIGPGLPIKLEVVLSEQKTTTPELQKLNIKEEQPSNEIVELVAEIRTVIPLLAFRDGQKVEAKVTELLNSYSTSLGLLPTVFTIEHTEGINLIKDVPTPKFQKAILLMRLKNILSELKADNSVEFLEQLKHYKTLIAEPCRIYQEDPRTPEEKISYIVAISQYYKIDNVANELHQLIDDSIAETSSALTRFLQSEIPLKIKPSTNFALSLDSLFDKVRAKEPLLKSLNGQSDDIISNAIRYLSASLDKMDESDSREFKKRLNDIIEKHKKKMFENSTTDDHQSILEDLQAILNSVSPLIEPSIKKRLASEKKRQFLDKLHEYKEVILEVDQSLRPENDGIRDVIDDIMVLANRDDISESEKMDIVIEAKRIISKWIGLAEDDEIDSTLEKIEQSRKRDDRDKLDTLFSIPRDQLINILIMKELYGLEREIITTIENKNTVETYKKEIQF